MEITEKVEFVLKLSKEEFEVLKIICMESNEDEVRDNDLMNCELMQVYLDMRKVVQKQKA